MADIYFKDTVWVGGSYWQLAGVKNVEPEKRGALSLEVQEYLVISGDISKDTAKDLARLRQEMEQAGHQLHYIQTENMKPKEVVDRLLETDDDDQRVVDTVKGLPPGPDDTQYGAALRELDSIAAKAKDSDAKYSQLRRSLAHYLPKMGGENTQGVAVQTAKLDDLYAQRRHTLAQIRYALNYRWALRKAGVKPEEVEQKFTSRVEKFGQPIKVVMTELDLKDGRRVKIEPFEIPRELLKL